MHNGLTNLYVEEDLELDLLKVVVDDALDLLLLAHADHKIGFILQDPSTKNQFLYQQIVVIAGSKELNLAVQELVEELDLCALDLGGKEHNLRVVDGEVQGKLEPEVVGPRRDPHKLLDERGPEPLIKCASTKALKPETIMGKANRQGSSSST